MDESTQSTMTNDGFINFCSKTFPALTTFLKFEKKNNYALKFLRC